MWNMVHLANLNGTTVICAIVHHQNLLAFRNQGIDADINIDGARAAEQNGCKLRFGCMSHFAQITTQAFHQACKLFLAGANVRYYLSIFDSICCSCRTWVQQHIALNLYIFQFHSFTF